VYETLLFKPALTFVSVHQTSSSFE